MPPAPTISGSTVPPETAPKDTSSDAQSVLSAKAAQAALRDPAINEEGFATSRVMALIAALLESPASEGISSRKRLIRSVKTCYRFVVTNEDGSKSITWWADLKKTGKVGKGEKAPCKPDVSMYLADRDLVDLATGKANPQRLYAAKRIRIRGDLDRVLRVEQILTHERAKVEALANGSTDGGAPASAGKKKSSSGRFFGGKPRSKL